MEEPTKVSPPSETLLLGKYHLGRLLGRGSFAKVYHARSVADGTGVAIKVIDKTKSFESFMEPLIVREVSVMRRLQHPNIIRIHEVMATKTKIYLVMELAKGGELVSKISRLGRLTESTARRYFQQLVSALRFCHKNGVTHHDIKPQNLLLDHEGNLKLSDFGLSALPEQLKDDGLLHTACGTPAYTAPEVIRRRGYDGAKADAWSCGVILFVFLAGFVPFDDTNFAVMYRKIYRKDFQFPSWFSKPVRWVISRLLDPNPETRIGIEALMEVAWFKRSFPSNNHIAKSSKDCEINQFELATPAAPAMNAFELITMSSGLDLSGLFETGKKKEKRFTSTASVKKIVERVMEVGGELGYSVHVKNNGSRLGLEKDMMVLLVEMVELTPSLALVVVKVVEGGMEFEELHWGEFRDGLEDVVLAWNEDSDDE